MGMPDPNNLAPMKPMESLGTEGMFSYKPDTKTLAGDLGKKTATSTGDGLFAGADIGGIFNLVNTIGGIFSNWGCKRAQKKYEQQYNQFNADAFRACDYTAYHKGDSIFGAGGSQRGYNNKLMSNYLKTTSLFS